jgi:5-methylcytosine-specific restriction endonuclease McrA
VASDVDDELRSAVTKRADGRCEYCLIQEEDAGFLHQVDHIVSRKHGGISTLENLALAGVICNRYKGTDIFSAHVTLVRLTETNIDKTLPMLANCRS